MEVIYFMKNIAQSEQKDVVSFPCEISNHFDLFEYFVHTQISAIRADDVLRLNNEPKNT